MVASLDAKPTPAARMVHEKWDRRDGCREDEEEEVPTSSLANSCILQIPRSATHPSFPSSSLPDVVGCGARAPSAWRERERVRGPLLADGIQSGRRSQSSRACPFRPLLRGRYLAL